MLKNSLWVLPYCPITYYFPLFVTIARQDYSAGLDAFLHHKYSLVVCCFRTRQQLIGCPLEYPPCNSDCRPLDLLQKQTDCNLRQKTALQNLHPCLLIILLLRLDLQDILFIVYVHIIFTVHYCQSESGTHHPVNRS